MIIAGRAGHNLISRGAKGILDEVEENRPIFEASKKYLSEKHKFVDCTAQAIASIHDDLMYGISKANQAKPGMFYAVHLNKAYKGYDGAIGAEVWVYSKDSKVYEQAERILKNLEKLGFINRGVKINPKYLELNSTNCPAMIVECFFLEATKDVELYKRLGPDLIGQAIANGIDETVGPYFTMKPVLKPKEPAQIIENKEYIFDNLVVYNEGADKRAAEYLQDHLKCIAISKDSLNINTLDAFKNIYMIGGSSKPVDRVILISGTNRYDTMQKVLEMIKG